MGPALWLISEFWTRSEGKQPPRPRALTPAVDDSPLFHIQSIISESDCAREPANGVRAGTYSSEGNLGSCRQSL